jgi:hypothetical protein
MVPVESLKPGDVVAVGQTPTRYAQPVAEVNLLEDGVELVFIEKSVVGDHGIRVAGVFAYQYPIALMGDVDRHVKETLERWVAEASGGTA